MRRAGSRCWRNANALADPVPGVRFHSALEMLSMDSQPVNPRSLVPQPCQLVIFGAAGDLAWRKLLPAVYNLNVDGALPSHFAVIGFGLPAEGAVSGDPDEYLRNRAKGGIQR